MKYTINEIQVGDEILFFNKGKKVEHNLFWKVLNKNYQGRLVVEIRDMGYAEKNIIDIRDVTELQKSVFNFEVALS